MYERKAVELLAARTSEQRKFIQVLIGPRQSGKTTIVTQVIARLNKTPCHYASADEPSLKGLSWLEQQWETARVAAKNGKALLVIDEVQKIHGWSEKVKSLWDEDSASGRKIFVILLGSSPLLMQKGLSESLAGRFETIHSTHWSFVEMKKAFGWNIEQYIYFGGYPGSAPLINDRARWADYIKNSLIETTISRDILLMTRIDKPSLLRRLFELGCVYSGQILSYQKMIGQLQDAGNTTTLAHYLELLSAAGMITGLQKYAGQVARRRGSSPKLQALNNALISAQTEVSFKEAAADKELWGRLVESAVGSHMTNAALEHDWSVNYWRDGDKEVDFVLHRGNRIIAIEVKSGRSKPYNEGIELFSKRNKVFKKLLVGTGGIPVKEFLTLDPNDLFTD